MHLRCLGMPLVLAFALGCPTSSGIAGEEPSFQESYARVIRANCLRCHNARDAKAGLDLSTRKGLLKGGDLGPAIVVGEPDESLLIQRVTEGSMPPISDGDQLPPADVSRLRDWIVAGAMWSGGPLTRPTNPAAKTSPQRASNSGRSRRRWFWRFRRRYRP